MSGGSYIGDIFTSFDKNGNVEFRTYDNDFNGRNTKEMKTDICGIITKNFETIPLKIRKEIRKRHEEHNIRFSCFKTLEANPDRIDKALYIFQIYTRSIIRLGSIEDENNKLIPEVEKAIKNVMNEMLEYLDERYV
jgi:hypothetical protein